MYVRSAEMKEDIPCGKFFHPLWSSARDFPQNYLIMMPCISVCLLLQQFELQY